MGVPVMSVPGVVVGLGRLVHDSRLGGFGDTIRRMELLTFAEAARLLGEDVNTVYRWARTEQCPVVRIGRKQRVPKAWVENPRGWLA